MTTPIGDALGRHPPPFQAIRAPTERTFPSGGIGRLRTVHRETA